MRKTEQLNVRISRRTRKVLDAIAEYWGSSQSEVLSVLLENEYRLIRRDSGTGRFGTVDHDLIEDITGIEVVLHKNVLSHEPHFGRRSHNEIDWDKSADAFAKFLVGLISSDYYFKGLHIEKEQILVTFTDDLQLYPAQYKALSSNLDVTSYHIRNLSSLFNEALKRVAAWVVMIGDSEPIYKPIAEAHIWELDHKLGNVPGV